MSRELERYSRDLPRSSRQQLQGTFAEALDGKLKVDAIWAITDVANASTVKVELHRRELVGDDQALSQVTAQYMTTACASTQRILVAPRTSMRQHGTMATLLSGRLRTTDCPA